jgi:hypothetical protein
MRRLLAWLVVTIGIAALVRRLRKRHEEHGQTAVADEDPADELRRKLAASRVEEEPAEVPAAPPAATVEERREDVHDQGRTALDEMRESES